MSDGATKTVADMELEKFQQAQKREIEQMIGREIIKTDMKLQEQERNKKMQEIVRMQEEKTTRRSSKT